jgi:Kef-type K+ transport system membrane component KefB
MCYRDGISFFLSLSITGLMAWGLIWITSELSWIRLPNVVTLIVYIIFAVIIIGYPIYTLARLSNRCLSKTSKNKKHS